MKRTVLFATVVAATVAVAAPLLSRSGAAPSRYAPLVVNGKKWEVRWEEAKARAAREGKPILLLQSFGRPGDPTACTNTRILTATVLKDPAFNQLLDQVVPSWDLVREAAKVTIDVGDGKVLHRTLRGNTCLYVLKPNGTVVDAFPGVYDPAALVNELKQSLKMVGKSDAEIRSWHINRMTSYTRPISVGLAMTKSAVERPLLTSSARNPGRNGGFARATSPQTADLAREFKRSTAALFDSSASPTLSGTPVLLGDTPRDRGWNQILSESATNLSTVRYVVHNWLASLEKPLQAPDAKRTMFETILHIDYTDPYLGLKDVELPGTPD